MDNIENHNAHYNRWKILNRSQHPKQMTRNRKFAILTTFALVLVTGFAGCGKQEQSEATTDITTLEQQSSIHVIDALGRTVDLKHPAIKIVSFLPSLTEYIYELDRGHLLVGRGDSCIYPPKTLELPIMGSLENPDIERIFNLKPDVVLVSKLLPREKLIWLEEAGLRVVVFDHQNWESLRRELNILGKLLDAEGDVRTLIAWMDRQRNNVISEVESLPDAMPIRTAVLYSLNPLTTLGKGTFIDEFIRLSGGKNIAADLNGVRPIISKDQIYLSQPEVILITKELAIESKLLFTVLTQESGSSIPAIQNHRVYQIDTDLLTIPGPRQILALRQIAAAIHPDIFEKPLGLIQIDLGE